VKKWFEPLRPDARVELDEGRHRGGVGGWVQQFDVQLRQVFRALALDVHLQVVGQVGRHPQPRHATGVQVACPQVLHGKRSLEYGLLVGRVEIVPETR
jgi:hypothetical protein